MTDQLGFSGGPYPATVRDRNSIVPINPRPNYKSLIRPPKPVVPAKTLENQSSINEILKNTAGEGAIIPILYGPFQVGGKVYALHYRKSTRTWTVGYVIGLGKTTGINSIDTVYANGIDAATITGLNVFEYRGLNSQTVDTIMKAAIESDGGPTYSDDLVINLPGDDYGIAHLVIQYTDDVFPQWPDIVIEGEGLPVFDPRGPTTAYSENPALHLGDYLDNTEYGLGLTVNAAGLEAAADYCDDTTGISPSEPRRTGFAVLDTLQAAEQQVELLRAAASCWVVLRGNEAVLVPDMPGSSVRHFTAEDIIAGTLRIRKQDSSDLPTVLSAYYTDTTGDIWKDALCTPVKAAGVDAGTTPWRESKIRLTGCTRHSQAVREVTERIDKLALSDLSVVFETFDEGLELEEGDIFTVTHPLGLSSKDFRAIEPPVQVRPGRFRVTGYEYSAAAYDNTVDAGNPIPDSVLPNAGVPSAPTTPAGAVPVWFQTTDGFWRSRFDISWTAPSDLSAVSHYFVRVSETVSGDVVFDTVVDRAITETSTPALKEDISYDFSIRAEFAGVLGPPLAFAETLTTNTVAPGTPTVSGSVRNAIVYLDWDAVTDAQYYEVRHNIDGGSWASAVVVDTKLSATTIAIDCTSPPYPGTIRKFMVRAYDSVGNNSNEGFVDIAVTQPASGITIFYEDLASIPTALAAGDIWYRTDADNRAYVATAAGDDEIDAGEWVLQSDTLQQKVDLSYINTVGTIQAASFTAVIQNRYGVDSETNDPTVLEIQLPNDPPNMARVYFWDAEGFFDVNPPVLLRGLNGGVTLHKIMEFEDDIKLNRRFFPGGFQYVASINSWQLV